MLEELSKPLAHLPPLLGIRTLRQAGDRAFDVAIRPPGSKSLTNRALLVAALADGASTIENALIDGDDALQMIHALTALGAQVRVSGDSISVTGVNGRWRVPPAGVTLNLNNAGTATRFLAAAAILSPAPLTIDGNARMRQRPIGELGDALRAMGCTVEYLGTPGCPPIRITPPADANTPAALTLGACPPASSSQRSCWSGRGWRAA